MNRTQRRSFAKKTGVSQEAINQFFGTKFSPEIAEGRAVKINYKSITGRKDYTRMSERYKAFVETHKDDVFTVEYDKGRKDNTLVCLAEDPNEVKWLWWTGDLIALNDQ